jgi:hypothetical protein
MKKAVLFFPDNASMAEFVIKEKVKQAELNSSEQTLVADMEDEEIIKAETLYGAVLKAMIPKN